MIQQSAVGSAGSFYGSLAGGVALFGDGRVDVSSNPSGASDFEFDTGLSAALRLGYDFGSLRLEGEISQIQADISNLDTVTGPVSVGSEYTSLGFMINGLWDFDFQPFVFSAGLGLGVSNSKFDEMSNAGFVAVAESEETVFAAQLILSAAYHLSENTSMGISYRYQMISDVNDQGFVDTELVSPSDMSFDNIDVSIFELFFTYEF